MREIARKFVKSALGSSVSRRGRSYFKELGLPTSAPLDVRLEIPSPALRIEERTPSGD